MIIFAAFGNQQPKFVGRLLINFSSPGEIGKRTLDHKPQASSDQKGRNTCLWIRKVILVPCVARISGQMSRDVRAICRATFVQSVAHTYYLYLPVNPIDLPIASDVVRWTCGQSLRERRELVDNTRQDSAHWPSAFDHRSPALPTCPPDQQQKLRIFELFLRQMDAE